MAEAAQRKREGSRAETARNRGGSPEELHGTGFCGLDWNDACLDLSMAQRPVRTASTVQVRQPIYRSSVGRWRSYAALLQPLIAELGDDTPT